MPKRSSFSSANSRHWARTGQPVHTFFASRVEPPFSGKNASGSVSAQSASSRQASGDGSGSSHDGVLFQAGSSSQAVSSYQSVAPKG